jgi:hypothetical protein
VIVGRVAGHRHPAVAEIELREPRKGDRRPKIVPVREQQHDSLRAPLVAIRVGSNLTSVYSRTNSSGRFEDDVDPEEREHLVRVVAHIATACRATHPNSPTCSV